MVRFIHERGGYTLIEIFIALTIVLLVMGGALGIYVMAMTAWKEGGIQISLQRKASIAMEKMVRGVDGRNGIRSASAVSSSSASTIQYTSGQERSFYLSGSEIMYDPDTSTSNDEYAIAENVTTPSGLTFSVSASGTIITINLSMQDNVMGKDINVSVSTQVKLRN